MDVNPFLAFTLNCINQNWGRRGGSNWGSRSNYHTTIYARRY